MIGVDTSVDERWQSGAPECALDYCSACSACLGCDGGAWCPDDMVTGYHLWLNEAGEVRLV